LHLGLEEVDVWVASLNCLPEFSRAMMKTLSTDEVEREFYYDTDRSRFLTARGILRDILSRYLGCTAAGIRFAYQPNGKPQLDDPEFTRTGLRFNLSHCTDTALYAVSRGREVGVDVESISSEVQWERLANSFFSPKEVAKLQQWPADRRTAAFFSCWTLKEAYVKARGEGFLMPLHSFEVAAGPGEEPALLFATNRNELDRWVFSKVPLSEGLAGALVAGGRQARVRLLSWNWIQAS
jgi:4'-phosphopantetheinyl transferase